MLREVSIRKILSEVKKRVSPIIADDYGYAPAYEADFNAYETIIKNFDFWYSNSTSDEVFALLVDLDCPPELRRMIRRREADEAWRLHNLEEEERERRLLGIGMGEMPWIH